MVAEIKNKAGFCFLASALCPGLPRQAIAVSEGASLSYQPGCVKASL